MLPLKPKSLRVLGSVPNTRITNSPSGLNLFGYWVLFLILLLTYFIHIIILIMLFVLDYWSKFYSQNRINHIYGKILHMMLKRHIQHIASHSNIKRIRPRMEGKGTSRDLGPSLSSTSFVHIHIIFIHTHIISSYILGLIKGWVDPTKPLDPPWPEAWESVWNRTECGVDLSKSEPELYGLGLKLIKIKPA